MSYRLFGAPRSRHLLTEMVLAEAGLDYSLELIDMKAGAHRKPDFLAINPMGWLPALVCPDGEVLYETPAIHLTLAERHGFDTVPSPGDRDRARFLGCYFNITGEIEPALKRGFYPQRYAFRPDDVVRVQDMAWAHVAERLERIETVLGTGPFFLGDRYSLADLTLAYWMVYIEQRSTLDPFPAVRCLCRAVEETTRAKDLFADYKRGVSQLDWQRETAEKAATLSN